MQTPPPQNPAGGSTQGSGRIGAFYPGASSTSNCGGPCAQFASCGDGCQCSHESSGASGQDTSYGLPGIATYGTFTCHAIAASAVMAMKPPSNLLSECKGRCLLEANGTIAMANSSGDFPTIANSYISSPLACPCNCTYASYGCCLSPKGLVFEESSKKAQTVIQGPPNQCCDQTTGNWTNGVVSSANNPACYATAKRSAMHRYRRTNAYSSPIERKTGPKWIK